MSRLMKDLDSIFIEHPAFETIMEEILQLVSEQEYLSEAPNLCITGPAGIGKSTLIKKLVNRLPRQKSANRVQLRNGSEQVCDDIPLLSLEMPPQPTANELARRMLQTIGDPFWYRGSRGALTDRFQTLARACGVKAVIIDEAQRAIDRNGVVFGEDLVEWLKEQHSALNVCVLLVGMGRVRYLLDHDDQVDRRWLEELEIPPYDWDAESDEGGSGRLYFFALLNAYQRELPVPLAKAIDLDDELVVKRFYYVSRGVIGLLKKLMLRATKIAINQGDSELTADTFRKAFDQAFRKEKLHEKLINPWGPAWDNRLPPRLRDHTALLHPKARRNRNRQARKSERRTEIISVLTKC